MAWCCVVDVAVLFFSLVMVFSFFGGKLINIDKHFDRVSTQNLKFQFEFVYCAQLWQNAVARMSTDDASLSRSCLGLVSVLSR